MCTQIKFLHCADVHIDWPFSTLDDPNLSKLRKQSLKDVFENIINISISENVDFLFICGDLFEQEYVKKSSINFINECFKKISNIKIFITPGNHDPYIINSYYSTYSWNDNVYIFNNSCDHVYIPEHNTYIWGTSFSSFEQPDSLIENIKILNSNAINILLTHGTLEMGFEHCKYNPLNLNKLDSLEMDYIGLGHFHNTLKNAGKNRNIFNPGSPEPLGFDELGDHGVFLGEIHKYDESPSTTTVKFVNTNVYTYKIIDINIPMISSDIQIINHINTEIAKNNISLENTLAQIIITGYVEKFITLDIEYIYNFFKEKVFFLKLSNETIPDYDLDTISREPGLRGLFVANMLKKINTTTDKNQEKLLYSALYLGIQAIDSGKIDL